MFWNIDNAEGNSLPFPEAVLWNILVWGVANYEGYSGLEVSSHLGRLPVGMGPATPLVQNCGLHCECG